MKKESIASKEHFSKGSLTMGAAIECDLTVDNYSIHKYEKVNIMFLNLCTF